MTDKTGIQWTDATWNPVRGCTKVSAGCDNCYAMGVAGGIARKHYEGLTRVIGGRHQWNGKIRLVPELLDQPLRWRRPRMIFVNSMSDLFHESVPFEFIAAVFGVMASSHDHVFQVLTKRPERMRDFFGWLGTHYSDPEGQKQTAPIHVCGHYLSNHEIPERLQLAPYLFTLSQVAERIPWPLTNVWLGVSAEDQPTADERMRLLRDTPAAVRWVSAEPLLRLIDMRAYLGQLDWVVVGGESGKLARPCDPEWIRDIVEQCRAADVPVFVKQLGSVMGPGKGDDPALWPTQLRVRQYPTRGRAFSKWRAAAS